VLGTLHHPLQDVAGPVRPVVGDHGIQRLEPLARLDCVDIGPCAVGAPVDHLDSIRHPYAMVRTWLLKLDKKT
jgi:hypothetical protein